MWRVLLKRCGTPFFTGNLLLRLKLGLASCRRQLAENFPRVASLVRDDGGCLAPVHVNRYWAANHLRSIALCRASLSGRLASRVRVKRAYLSRALAFRLRTRVRSSKQHKPRQARTAKNGEKIKGPQQVSGLSKEPKGEHSNQPTLITNKHRPPNRKESAPLNALDGASARRVIGPWARSS